MNIPIEQKTEQEAAQQSTEARQLYHCRATEMSFTIVQMLHVSQRVLKLQYGCSAIFARQNTLFKTELPDSGWLEHLTIFSFTPNELMR